jgi:hypothetical protein
MGFPLPYGTFGVELNPGNRVPFFGGTGARRLNTGSVSTFSSNKNINSEMGNTVKYNKIKEITMTTESKTFNTTSFSDEQFRRMLDAGFTVQQIEAANAQIEYRREYNQRPEVKAKRAAYNAERNERLKMIKSLLK